MLSVKNLTVEADGTEILHDISCDFSVGRTYVIMGANGSGKSTLVHTLMGSPALTATHGTITLDDENITEIAPHKRAKKGLFLSPQSPLALSGISVQQLLRTAIPRDQKSSKELFAEIKNTAQELYIDPALLTRSLNENFSGGERKKMEILQAAILDPRYIILDEIDTGVDVDALKIIAQYITKIIARGDKTVIMITHYNRILTHLSVDEVFVMRDGKVAEHGDATLAQKIEKDGYKSEKTQ